MKQPNVRWDRVRFGVFEADLRSGELRKYGMRIRLQALPFKLLAILVERPGEVVTKEEIKERVWGNSTVVDFDHSIGTAINKIRETFDDSAESPRYIETLARRGYRFIAPVQPIESSSPSDIPEKAQANSPATVSTDSSTRIAAETPLKATHGEPSAENQERRQTDLLNATISTHVDTLEPARFQPEVSDSETKHAIATWRNATFLLAALLLISITAIVFTVTQLRRPAGVSATSASPDPAVRTFWNGILSGSEAPWVVFSNATFVGTPDKGMRYYRPDVDPPREVHEHYTGVGEVLSIHELDETLGQLGYRVRVKRGALLSLDDAKNTNLIFVGAPVENLRLNDIPTTRDFKFQVVSDGPRKGDVAVIDVHPAPGERPMYINSSEKPIVDDYAVVALFPGINQQRSILLAAGTTTIGTEAAVEYICHANTLSNLLQRLGNEDVGKPFEAVLYVRIAHDVPIETEIVAVHKIANENQQASSDGRGGRAFGQR